MLFVHRSWRFAFVEIQWLTAVSTHVHAYELHIQDVQGFSPSDLFGPKKIFPRPEGSIKMFYDDISLQSSIACGEVMMV